MVAVRSIDQATVEFQQAREGVTPFRPQKVVNLAPRRVVREAAPDNDMTKDQTLAGARPAADCDLDAIVLHVATGGQDQDFDRDPIKAEIFGASSERAFVDHRRRASSLAENGVREDL